MHSIAQGILTHGFFLDQTLLLSDFAIQTVPRPSAGCRRGASSPDPAPRLLSLPPQYAVAQVVGCLQGKRATHIARACSESDLDK